MPCAINAQFWVRLMILLYLDCDIAFPSPAFARAGDGAAQPRRGKTRTNPQRPDPAAIPPEF